MLPLLATLYRVTALTINGTEIKFIKYPKEAAAPTAPLLMSPGGGKYPQADLLAAISEPHGTDKVI